MKDKDRIVTPPTILNLKEILDEILHEPVLLGHVALEVDHLVEDVLVVTLEVANVRGHLLLCPGHAIDLLLHELDGGVWETWGGGLVGARRRGIATTCAGSAGFGGS